MTIRTVLERPKGHLQRTKSEGEVDGLMAGQLMSGDAPAATTRLNDWLKDNGDGLGRWYVSELGRNYRGLVG